MRKEIKIAMAAIMIASIMVVMVGSVTAANCEQLREECREIFEADCEAAKDYNCERFGGIYSGCALDVVCGTGHCSYAYADPWCNMPGYVECANPIMEEYMKCLKQCNEDAPAREGERYNARMKRLGDCGSHCWEEAKQKLIACRKEACEAYCREQGSSGGAVVKGVCKCDVSLTPTPTVTFTPTPTPRASNSCDEECKKLFGSRADVEIIESGGTYPNCRCVVDYRDTLGRLTKTVIIEVDIKTTYIFNPKTEELIRKETISLSEEREKIRKELGYKYTEDQIDKMLDDKEITAWFDGLMKDIKTETRIWYLGFWWQHFLAVLDHGFSGNSADFVDTYKFGRCGDSMLWLENRLANKLDLPADTTARQQAMLSITREGTILDHTSILIRPKGISNSEWADIVQTLNTKSSGEKGKGGLDKADIKQLDPRLLSARVIDPYYKKTYTLEEFIEGWPTIRIS